MRSKLLVAAIAASLAFTAACEQPAPGQQSATAAPAPEAQAPAESTNQPSQDIRGKTLVTVNGEDIKGETFAVFLNQRLVQSKGQLENSPQVQNQSMNELINIVLLAQAANSAGLAQRGDVAAALALQRQQSLSRLALQEFAANNPASDEELKKLYDERYAQSSDEEYHARHILVKEEAKAKELIEQLKGGADFAELAKEHSTGPTGVKGGDLGWFDAGQMVKPFSDAVKAMDAGSYSAEPVQTQFGWHVIQLEEKRAKEPPAFDAVKASLSQEIQRDKLGAYVNQLRQAAKVEVNEAFARKPDADEAEQKSE